MATHSTRPERVAELVQQEIGLMLTNRIKDPRIGFVTVTGAKMSPDLREAWVYYAVHGDSNARQETRLGLEAAKGFVKRELGKSLKLRLMPEIHFVYDESIDRGDRIERLIKEVHETDRLRGQGGPGSTGTDKGGGGQVP